MANDPADLRATRESLLLWRWQQRMLPYVLGGVALLALFFFVSSFIQLGRLNEAVAFIPDTQLEATLKSIDARTAMLPAPEATELLRWKTMVLLEADVVRHRYAQVNATLMMRAWTRHTGFVTGMILTFLGALFILTKLSEAQTQLGGEAVGVKATLATSSPGIVLAVLGTALMLVTLTADFRYGTSDVPVYLLPVAAAPPPSLPEEEVPPKDPESPPPPVAHTPDSANAPR